VSSKAYAAILNHASQFMTLRLCWLAIECEGTLAQTFFDIRFDRNRIELFGDMRLNYLDQVTSALYQIGVQARYPDITLNLRNVTSILPSMVPPLAAYLRYLTQQYKIDYTLIQPQNQNVANRIINLGLAHYIDYRRFEKPGLRSAKPTVMQFYNLEDCIAVTDKIINNTIRTIKLSRTHIAALEWAVTEITDNVLNHSQSPIGGFAIYHHVPRTNIVEFTVADCGVGVARTLGVKDEREAVELAVQEGVTRNKATNQGNGLYGTYRLACASSCIFSLRSRHGTLYVDKEGEVHTRRTNVPFHGTFVICQIDCNEPDLIKRAFNFGGRPHEPAFDYVEKKHELDDGAIRIVARDICKTFGSRESGREARLYIENILESVDGAPVHIDFKDVPVISSSFADEVFGKLFVAMGSMKFMRLVQLKNLDSTVEGLIGRAIDQRSRTGLGEGG
jgi:anti-sigma regulatory factor (Ser/Thr protein kinase)